LHYITLELYRVA